MTLWKSFSEERWINEECNSTSFVHYEAGETRQRRGDHDSSFTHSRLVHFEWCFSSVSHEFLNSIAQNFQFLSSNIKHFMAHNYCIIVLIEKKLNKKINTVIEKQPQLISYKVFITLGNCLFLITFMFYESLLSMPVCDLWKHKWQHDQRVLYLFFRIGEFCSLFFFSSFIEI